MWKHQNAHFPTMSKTVLLLLGAVILLAAAPSVSAMIITGHSPINILLTDPNGHEFGCTSSTCNYTTNFVDTLPKSECQINGKGPALCLYIFPLTSGGTTNIFIPNPAPGIWTVTYFGTGTGTFTITGCSSSVDSSTASSWSSSDWDSSDLCGKSSTITIASGTLTGTGCAFTSAGCSDPLGVNSDGTLYIPTSSLPTPEFPFGSLAMVSTLFAAFLVLSWLRKKRD